VSAPCQIDDRYVRKTAAAGQRFQPLQKLGIEQHLNVRHHDRIFVALDPHSLRLGVLARFNVQKDFSDELLSLREDLHIGGKRFSIACMRRHLPLWGC